jgi:hypothetical protein
MGVQASGMTSLQGGNAYEAILPHTKPISKEDALLGRTAELDEDPRIAWVGGHYQETDDATAGRILKTRAIAQFERTAAEREAKRLQALQEIADKHLEAGMGQVVPSEAAAPVATGTGTEPGGGIDPALLEKLQAEERAERSIGGLKSLVAATGQTPQDLGMTSTGTDKAPEPKKTKGSKS